MQVYSNSLNNQWAAIGQQISRAAVPALFESFRSPALTQTVNSITQNVAHSFVKSGALDSVMAGNQEFVRKLYSEATKSFVENLYKPSIDWEGILPHRLAMPTSLLGQAAGAVSDSLVAGRVSPELCEEAERFLETESPELSMAVRESVDGVVAWDASTKEHVKVTWRVTYFLVLVITTLWMCGAFPDNDLDDDIKPFITFLFGGNVRDKLVSYFRTSKTPPDAP